MIKWKNIFRQAEKATAEFLERFFVGSSLPGASKIADWCLVIKERVEHG